MRTLVKSGLFGCKESCHPSISAEQIFQTWNSVLSVFRQIRWHFCEIDIASEAGLLSA